MAFRAVLLPAPFGPIRPHDAPFLDLEVDAVQRHCRAVHLAKAARFDHSHRFDRSFSPSGEGAFTAFNNSSAFSPSR